MTKTEEIEMLKARIKELEDRQLEREIKRLKKDIEFMGCNLMAFGNDNAKSHVIEIYERWGIEA